MITKSVFVSRGSCFCEKYNSNTEVILFSLSLSLSFSLYLFLSLFSPSYSLFLFIPLLTLSFSLFPFLLSLSLYSPSYSLFLFIPLLTLSFSLFPFLLSLFLSLSLFLFIPLLTLSFSLFPFLLSLHLSSSFLLSLSFSLSHLGYVWSVYTGAHSNFTVQIIIWYGSKVSIYTKLDLLGTLISNTWHTRWHKYTVYLHIYIQPYTIYIIPIMFNVTQYIFLINIAITISY